MALKIFLSYSTGNLVQANAIADSFKKEGYEVFFAEETARCGDSLPETLKKNITGCDVFVFLWSKAAKTSKWVSQEIGIAEGAGKESLPVVLERGIEPEGFVANRKYLPAYEEFETAMTKLHESLRCHSEAKAKSEKAKKEQEETDSTVKGVAILGLGALALWAIASSK